MTNQILPFALGDGANVSNYAAWQADSARQTGFQAGPASSQKINTAIRQASFIAAMIANFTAAQSGDDVLDNGDLAAILESYESGLLKFVQKTGINVGATPPQYPVEGTLWCNTGTVPFVALNDRIPPLGLAIYLTALGWKWIAGGSRNFASIAGASQVVQTATNVTAILTGNSPSWGSYNSQNGKLTINVAGDYLFAFNAQVNVAFSSAPGANGDTALMTGISKNGAWEAHLEMPMANAGVETDGSTAGYIFMQAVTMTDTCAIGDIIEPMMYVFDGASNVATVTTMSLTAFRASRLS